MSAHRESSFLRSASFRGSGPTGIRLGACAWAGDDLRKLGLGLGLLALLVHLALLALLAPLMPLAPLALLALLAPLRARWGEVEAILPARWAAGDCCLSARWAAGDCCLLSASRAAAMIARMPPRLPLFSTALFHVPLLPTAAVSWSSSRT